MLGIVRTVKKYSPVFLSILFVFSCVSFPIVVSNIQNDILSPVVLLRNDHGSGSAVCFARVNGWTYALTASHVVYHPFQPNIPKLEVVIWDYGLKTKKRIVAADVVNSFAHSDLAIIRFKDDRVPLAKLNFEFNVGECVFAVGCPYGMPPLICHGNIARKVLTVRYPTQTVLDILCINSSIHPGMSGGGVFKADTHELIGIISIRFYRDDAFGGIIPLSYIRTYLEEKQWLK